MRVLDPMVGTGSTLVACARCGRNAVGVELSPVYVDIAKSRVDEVRRDDLELNVIQGDASDINGLVSGQFDYCITSPPYWDMLRTRGSETQEARRENEELDTYYSEDGRDLGNIEDYREFVDRTVDVYREVVNLLKPGAYMTVVVKNVKKGGTLYPLAWDLARDVGGFMQLKDEKIWCQDNQKLAPYGYRYSWVSNTMHHYCLNFKVPVK
jgi:DNA modification methylase